MGRGGWILWALLTATGILLMALPDDDARLFSISRTHGPAALDALGAMIVLAGWGLLLRAIWRGRARLRGRWPLLGAGLALGAVLSAWTILGDLGAWWILGVGVLAGVQVLAAAVASARA